MSDYLDINNEELLKDFFSEAEQQVDNLESNILVIENDPSNHDAIDEIFRAAHTLKGGSATVEMMELSHFCHDVEDLLDALRSNLITVTEPVVDVLLSAIDVIKAMLEARSNGSIYQEDVAPIIQKINSFIPAKPDKKAKKKAPSQFAPTLEQAKAPAPQPVAQNAAAGSTNVRTLSEYELLELKQSCQGNQKVWCIAVEFDETNPMNSVGGIQVFAALKACGSVLKTEPDFDDLYEDEFHRNVLYYIASDNTQEQIEDVAFLDDVTLKVDAQLVVASSDNTAKPVAPAPQATATPTAQVQVASQPAPTTPTPQATATKPATPATPQATAPQAPAGAKPPAKPAGKGAPATGHNINQSGSILRVDSKRIDYLLNLVSETVITKAAFNQTALHFGDLQAQFLGTSASFKEKVRNMFERLPQYLEEIQNGVPAKDIKANIITEFGDIANYFDSFDATLKSEIGKFRSSTQNLGRIAGELQEGVMKIRMVPINQIFSRFPRVVRDLGRDLNRKVNLVIEGEDTELDKTVVDDLLDPIMHCVRNSVDHGIETPEDRKKVGKAEEGTLLLKANNEGNVIVIEISDDGAGIDVDKVKSKAIEKGLIHPSKILTDQEAYQLIFLPGFSTSDKISAVSGRGVGLDVVQTSIEKLNGTVTVTSARNVGTKFTIKLPLTLAILQGLLVRVGREVYSIPIASVIESHRIKETEINTIDNYEVFNVRNEVISVLRLSRLFNIKHTDEDTEYRFVVIVGSQEKKIGIMVDALIGEEDVVIKPLKDQYTTSPGIAGASILGDGSVSLIIDVGQLLELGVKQEIDARQERENSLLN